MMQPAIVIVCADRCGPLHVECLPTLAACATLLSDDGSFLRRYGFDRLVYCECYDRYHLAQARAEQLRHLSSDELRRRVARHNPSIAPLPLEQTCKLSPMRRTLSLSSRRSRQRQQRTILPLSLLPPHRLHHE